MTAASNRTYTYLANDVTMMQGQKLEATEELRVHLSSQDEVHHILAAGKVIQALHAAPLWQFLLLQRE